MPTKYFRLMATDGSPAFEPTSCFEGHWSGVGRVEDDVEIGRLTKRGCAEITESEYLELVKKKAQQQKGLPDFRPVTLEDLARPVVPATEAPKVEPSKPKLTLDDVSKPKPLPRQRKAPIIVPDNPPTPQ